MTRLIWQRATGVLVLLWLATLTSWLVGHGDDMRGPALPVLTALVVACVKARLVASEFMEVRLAPRILGLGIDLYLMSLMIVLSSLILLYPVILK